MAKPIKISRKDLQIYDLLDKHTNSRKRGFEVEPLKTQDFFKHHYGMSNYYWTGSWSYSHRDMGVIKEEYPDVLPLAQELDEALEELGGATGRVNRAIEAYTDALWQKLYSKRIDISKSPTFISDEEEAEFAKKQKEEIEANLAQQALAKKEEKQNG
jgi:adenylate kinase family enzyme